MGCSKNNYLSIWVVKTPPAARESFFETNNNEAMNTRTFSQSVLHILWDVVLVWGFTFANTAILLDALFNLAGTI
jgi:hypothetical protein